LSLISEVFPDYAEYSCFERRTPFGLVFLAVSFSSLVSGPWVGSQILVPSCHWMCYPVFSRLRRTSGSVSPKHFSPFFAVEAPSFLNIDHFPELQMTALLRMGHRSKFLCVPIDLMSDSTPHGPKIHTSSTLRFFTVMPSRFAHEALSVGSMNSSLLEMEERPRPNRFPCATSQGGKSGGVPSMGLELPLFRF